MPRPGLGSRRQQTRASRQAAASRRRPRLPDGRRRGLVSSASTRPTRSMRRPRACRHVGGVVSATRAQPTRPKPCADMRSHARRPRGPRAECAPRGRPLVALPDEAPTIGELIASHARDMLGVVSASTLTRSRRGTACALARRLRCATPFVWTLRVPARGAGPPCRARTAPRGSARRLRFATSATLPPRATLRRAGPPRRSRKAPRGSAPTSASASRSRRAVPTEPLRPR